jgi:putative endonuclease
VTTDRRATGAEGESLAANYLTRRGWTVLARNWRCRTGEIDLVARDPDGAMVICEVKCRTGDGYGDPLESITDAKLARLRALAAEWRRSQDGREGPLRIDAIGVRQFRDGTSRVTHVQGIGA